MSSAGWGQGGVYLAELTWHDGCDSCDTNLPIPKPPPPQPSNFKSNLTGPWQPAESSEGQWVPTPQGLQGGAALGRSFLTSNWQEITTGTRRRLECQWDFMLITTNGNPTTSPNTWTRWGSSALFGFRLASRSFSDIRTTRGYLVNATTAGGGGVTIVSMPSGKVIATSSLKVKEAIPYHAVLTIDGGSMLLSFNQLTPMRGFDTTYTQGWVGVGVETGATTFQNVNCRQA